MLVKDLIEVDIPSLKTSDTGLLALSIMDDHKVSHLPIVNHVEFLGLITEDDILNLNHPEWALGEHELSLFKPYVEMNQHIFEAIYLMSELKLTLIPVVDEHNHYKGYLDLPCVTEKFAHLATLNEPGSLLILSVGIRDYSLAEIAKIVESNDARIMSCYLNTHSESTEMEVTLKINRGDLSGIIQTFNRYNYVVKASYQESKHDEDMKGRFDQFMNYLNM
jgi:acetoin utilization protein AcuB